MRRPVIVFAAALALAAPAGGSGIGIGASVRQGPLRLGAVKPIGDNRVAVTVVDARGTTAYFGAVRSAPGGLLLLRRRGGAL